MVGVAQANGDPVEALLVGVPEVKATGSPRPRGFSELGMRRSGRLRRRRRRRWGGSGAEAIGLRRSALRMKEALGFATRLRRFPENRIYISSLSLSREGGDS